MDEEMKAPAVSKEKHQEPIPKIISAIAAGLVLVIIGSIIGSCYAKETIINYAGFGMQLAGIAIFLIGISGTVVAVLKTRLKKETAATVKVNRPKVLFISIRAVGIGIILTVIGSMLSSSYAVETVMNYAGFEMLQVGIFVFILGIFGTTLTTLKTYLDQKETLTSVKNKPRVLRGSIVLIGVGIALAITGSLVAGSYAKETLINYAGFGMLLSGIAFFVFGISGTATITLKSYLNKKETPTCARINKPRVLFISIWSISIGIVLTVIGSLVSSSYAKETIMNYAGFGMLLSGICVFILGAFEATRIYATVYLNKRRAKNMLISKTGAKKSDFKKKEKLSKRLKNLWSYLVTTRALLNLAGIMTAMGLLLFGIWQLDLIVSGPVWWSEGGTGWSHPNGAYSNDYFQCFLWKTTIGEAYDTLFLLIFISFIVLFVSTFFWPRWRVKND